MPDLLDRLETAPINPDYNAKLLPLESWLGNDGTPTRLVVAQIMPGGRVPAHLHEQGGELCLTLSDVTAYFGEPVRDQEGNLVFNKIQTAKGEDRAEVNWETGVDARPGDRNVIPEGKAHYFVNNSDRPCNVAFFLPETHIPDQNGYVADRTWAVPLEEYVKF